MWKKELNVCFNQSPTSGVGNHEFFKRSCSLFNFFFFNTDNVVSSHIPVASGFFIHSISCSSISSSKTMNLLTEFIKIQTAANQLLNTRTIPYKISISTVIPYKKRHSSKFPKSRVLVSGEKTWKITQNSGFIYHMQYMLNTYCFKS